MLFNDSQIDNILFDKPLEKTIITVWFPVVFTFGFIGNKAFWKVVALVKEMHTLTNFYFAKLAVAVDLLYIVLFLS